MGRGKEKRPKKTRRAKIRRAVYAAQFKRHQPRKFEVDTAAVRQAIEPVGPLTGIAGEVTGGTHTRLSVGAAQRVADVVNGPASAAAVRKVYGLTGAAGTHKHRGNGVLVGANYMEHSKTGKIGLRHKSTHTGDCPNPWFKSKVPAHSINLLVQLQGKGKTGVCPLPPDKEPPKEATEGCKYCISKKGAKTCEVGSGLALLTSIAHTPLPQSGAKLVLTLFFPPPRGRKSTGDTELGLGAAWADSGENGWVSEGCNNTPPFQIPWVVGPGDDE